MMERGAPDIGCTPVSRVKEVKRPRRAEGARGENTNVLESQGFQGRLYLFGVHYHTTVAK